MFEQHAVPQNISSYQFKLVGDMTLKQFLEVAAGVIIALGIYSTPLPGFLKWPVMLFFVSLGAALAFLPIQDRPMEIWLTAFFKSIYSPTLFDWKKENKSYFSQPQIKSVTSSQTQQTNVIQATATTTTESGAADVNKPEFTKTLEEAEKSFLSKISNVFSTIQTPMLKTPQQKVIEPFHPTVSTNIDPVIPASIPIPETQNTTTTPLSIDGMLSITDQPKVQTQDIYVRKEKKEVNIPIIQNISVEKQTEQSTSSKNTIASINLNNQNTKNVSTPSLPISQMNITPTPLTQSTIPITQNQTTLSTISSTPPPPPEKPNIIVGQILDTNGNIIENAIIDILDSQNRPVRALRTNRAGHFQIVTPLQNGNYIINAEREPYKFNSLQISLDGNIVQPIVIKSN